MPAPPAACNADGSPSELNPFWTEANLSADVPKLPYCVAACLVRSAPVRGAPVIAVVCVPKVACDIGFPPAIFAASPYEAAILGEPEVTACCPA